MRNSLRRIPRFHYFCDTFAKQDTVILITISGISTVALVISVERRRRQRLFFAWHKFSNSRLQDCSSCAPSFTVTILCLTDKLHLTLSAYFNICAFVLVILLCDVRDFGLLHYMCFFVICQLFSDFGYFTCPV